MLQTVTDKLESTRDIAAPPDAVYAAISDVTRMGEWSDECYACEWHEGFDRPKVGATFDGHNRNGDKNWTTQGKVVEADPGRAFTFECSEVMFTMRRGDTGSNLRTGAAWSPSGPRTSAPNRC